MTQSLYFWGPMLIVLIVAGGFFSHFLLSTANSFVHNLFYSESEILILKKSNETKNGGLISYLIHGNVKYMKVDKENYDKVNSGDKATLKDSVFFDKILTIKDKMDLEFEIYKIRLKIVNKGKMMIYLIPLSFCNNNETSLDYDDICKEVNREQYDSFREGDIIKVNKNGGIVQSYKVY